MVRTKKRPRTKYEFVNSLFNTASNMGALVPFRPPKKHKPLAMVPYRAPSTKPQPVVHRPPIMPMPTKTAERVREMAPLTGEKDVRTVYRRRRMPRRRKRRYLRKLKQFRSLEMRNEPCRITQFVEGGNVGCIANQQRWFGFFYGLCDQQIDNNSIRDVWNTLSPGTSWETSANLRIDHMALSVVLRNVTSGLSSTESPTIDLDVYKVVCQRDVPKDLWRAGVALDTFIRAMNDRLREHAGYDIPKTDAGAGIGVINTGNSTAVGNMLWNNPPFLRYFKIIRQTKIQVPLGGVVHFNMRSSKNKVVNKESCVGNVTGSLACKKYLTAGYIFNINGRFDSTVGGFSACSMDYEIYTRYNCKPLKGIADTLVYN